MSENGAFEVWLFADKVVAWGTVVGARAKDGAIGDLLLANKGVVGAPVLAARARDGSALGRTSSSTGPFFVWVA